MLARLAAAITAGWMVYILVWIGKDYHGGLEILFQPIMALIVSSVFSLAALLIGLPLRVPWVASQWQRVGRFSLLLTVGGLIAIFYAEKLGLTREGIHPETNEPVQAMTGMAYCISFLAVVFPLVNWPRAPSPRTGQSCLPDEPSAGV